MRKSALAIAALLSLAAGAPDPQKIVFARVWPNAGQVGLFIADADGANERPLVGLGEIDYDPVWSPDGRTIVFTSDRLGSADLFRVNPDGTGVERLTDSPAYDDQAAFSPDGRQLVFVTTRNGGTADLWTLDLQTKKAKALTSGPGGDFRPAWSADGTWIAFSSDRGSTMPMGHGRWEHLQLADLYLVHPDGTGLKRITEHGKFCGSPKFSADSRRLIAYCMNAEDTLEARRPSPRPENDKDTRQTIDSRLVSIDVATGAIDRYRRPEPGMKFNPSFAAIRRRGICAKGRAEPAFTTPAARPVRKGDIRAAAWSPDGTARRVPPAADGAADELAEDIQPESAVRADADRHPAVVQRDRRQVRDDRPAAPGTALGASLQIVTTGTQQCRHDLSGEGAKRDGAELDAVRRQDPVRHRRLQPLLQRLQRPGPQRARIVSKAARRSRWSTPTAAATTR